MDISGTSPVTGPGGVQGPRGPRALPPTPPLPTGGTDRVEISSVARYASAVRNVPEIRQEKVDSIRRQIEAGTYESEDKIRTAVERFLEDIKRT